ncbi:hypothetical protein BJ912DRAFT_654089 [Pholiota molesta]|nr:hypothetical protein BJ912DRAFT_654089 [Pholiota molesta]
MRRSKTRLEHEFHTMAANAMLQFSNAFLIPYPLGLLLRCPVDALLADHLSPAFLPLARDIYIWRRIPRHIVICTLFGPMTFILSLRILGHRTRSIQCLCNHSTCRPYASLHTSIPYTSFFPEFLPSSFYFLSIPGPSVYPVSHVSFSYLFSARCYLNSGPHFFFLFIHKILCHCLIPHSICSFAYARPIHIHAQSDICFVVVICNFSSLNRAAV